MRIPLPTIEKCLAACALLMAASAGSAHGPSAPRETIVPAFAHAITSVPGKVVTALVVSYQPGGRTPPHRHGQAFVIGYVLEGSVRSRLDNGEEQIYRAGESWTEGPGAHHLESDNASDIESAKLLAIFITDSKDKDLVIFDKQ
ncbi:cupin domain-containing protein [Hydrogenophaga sp.]|uniref:cupin domain-containing protein n=1 Tax=Hydrogenophaga sp. TaxID=1904254 RepID=UPI00356859CB